MNPKKDIAYSNRGICEKKLNDFVNAMKDYNKAIELAPTDGNYYYNRGILELKLKKTDDAYIDLVKAKKNGNTDAQSLLSNRSIFKLAN